MNKSFNLFVQLGETIFEFVNAVVRGEKARREYDISLQRHRAAVVIQKNIKNKIARKNLKSLHDASIVIQSGRHS